MDIQNTSYTPPSTSDSISLLPYLSSPSPLPNPPSPLPPSKWMSYVYHPLLIFLIVRILDYHKYGIIIFSVWTQNGCTRSMHKEKILEVNNFWYFFWKSWFHRAYSRKIIWAAVACKIIFPASLTLFWCLIFRFVSLFVYKAKTVWL